MTPAARVMPRSRAVLATASTAASDSEGARGEIGGPGVGSSGDSLTARMLGAAGSAVKPNAASIGATSLAATLAEARSQAVL